MRPKKILILGSGALKIGQAGEFDYSGSQAIKAFKEEGVKTALINPNIATAQTDEGLADKVYFLPLTASFVEKVIKKERPDSIALSFGGQTALNCGLELGKKRVLKKYGVKVLGTPIAAIEITENRSSFRKMLGTNGVASPKGKTVKSIKEGLAFAKEAGYPVFLRLGYALGGEGSGVARNKKNLTSMLQKALSESESVLIEEFLEGWKEIEYEIMRDFDGNCIAVCNMENVDPMGVHTGESIVVAPSQTLTNTEYHLLREVCKKIVAALGIVGECNVQFALSPKTAEYRVIEVNARLSRSSALASKATGYPIAYVAAKLCLGFKLADLVNKITGKTSAFFEPALDYVVTKVPRWDLQKFNKASQDIGSEMKSVGEVMAIGRTFEESLQKAFRMLAKGLHGVVGDNLKLDLKSHIKRPSELRIIAIARALELGWSVKKISKMSRIDSWFVQKIANIVASKKELARLGATKETLLKAKKLGFSDWQIAKILGKEELKVRFQREQWGIRPVVKQIDTMAAEWPAKTNYLYFTYHGQKHDLPKSNKKSVVVLGSGPYRIGSSVEFDWCCVQALKAARLMGFQTVMVNYNPETVSTDFDESDRLYFEELSLERILDIYNFEKPEGLIVSMGGQLPNNVASKCGPTKMRVLGTNPQSIDRAENRFKFSRLLDSLGIKQPQWAALSSLERAKEFAKKVGYPVLIRPSYVLSGDAMTVVWSSGELGEYLKKAARVSPEYPVVISKFIADAKEIEVDAVAQAGNIAVSIISEHIESSGTHSGDSFVATPSQRMYTGTLRAVQEIAAKVAKALRITGPFNIQFLAKDGDLFVIECNLRSSRSFPFVSKVHKKNLAELATRAILGKKLEKQNRTEQLNYVGVKAPQFSFARLKGADPLPSVEMASTGEVGCLGKNLEEAFLKAAISVGIYPPKKSVLFSIGGDKQKFELLESVRSCASMGLKIFATLGTAKFYKKRGVKIFSLHKAQEQKEPNALTYIKERKVDFIVSLPREDGGSATKTAYLIRRLAVDYNVPLLTNANTVKLFFRALKNYSSESKLEIVPTEDY